MIAGRLALTASAATTTPTTVLTVERGTNPADVLAPGIATIAAAGRAAGARQPSARGAAAPQAGTDPITHSAKYLRHRFDTATLVMVALRVTALLATGIVLFT